MNCGDDSLTGCPAECGHDGPRGGRRVIRLDDFAPRSSARSPQPASSRSERLGLGYVDPVDGSNSAGGEPLFEAIASHSTDSIMLLDREARILFINRTAPGLTVEEVVGTPVYNYVPEEQHTAMRQCFAKVLTGEPGRYENSYHLSDGRVMRWESRVGAVRNGDQITGFVVFASDVTVRTTAAMERDSIFELSADLMCVVDHTGRFTRVNPAFTRTLGYTEAELVNTMFMEFVDPIDNLASAAAFTEALEKPITAFENRYVCKDGSTRWLQWTARPDPISKCVVAVARDITKTRALEEQLRHAQKMEAVGQLAGGVAHDFNNLMQAILGNVHFALATNPDAEMRSFLDDIAVAGKRAAELTKQLLTFGRRQPLAVASVDLNLLARDVTQLLRRVMPESIDIALVAGHQLAPVEGDRFQLEQVVMNLCLNARDAMPSGGHLLLETENVLIDATYANARLLGPGRYVCVTVSDDGVGMSAEVQARIFEPFFTTKPFGEGTGLGLAVAYGIVQQHAGLLVVSSELGRGAVFKLYLPVVVRDAGHGPNPSAGKDRGVETVLVAEDELLVRNVLVRILERAGYRVLAAAGGAAAIKLCHEHDEINLAVLDVVMPDFNGPEVYERIQKIRPGLPSLFCSGYSDASRAGHRLPEGATLISKPFNVEAFLVSVRKALDHG
ncbi:MAG: PAS domain S-box protein [Kofleriaceae bacterium]